MLLQSTYETQFPVASGHLETILPYFLRRVVPVDFQRERLVTDDGDFLDLDWLKSGQSRLAVLSHGLEGCSRSNYIQGLTQTLAQQGFDVLAWNNRGCGGETNNLLKMYHSGASDDLARVLNHVFKTTSYPDIYLVGFSMGGNITLKYMGEEGDQISPRIRSAVVVSVPVHLGDCAVALSNGFSKVYSRNFILRLTKKMKIKQEQFPDIDLEVAKLRKIWDFKSFDDKVTAPMHGFENAEDYWEKSSSYHWLDKIKAKVLIVNALNDPYLMGRCYPINELRTHPMVDLEIPERGGHVSFMKKSFNDTWVEQRIVDRLLEES